MFDGLRGFYQRLIHPFSDPVSSQPIQVVDGDTLRVGQERMRLLGMDAPESGQRDGRGNDAGAAAKQVLSNLVQGQRVRIERQGQDVYGRTLVHVSTDQCKDVSLEMVRQGYAVLTWDPTPTYQAAFAQAKSKKLGLWSQDGFEEPHLWRQRQKELTGTPWIQRTHSQNTAPSTQSRPNRPVATPSLQPHAVGNIPNIRQPRRNQDVER